MSDTREKVNSSMEKMKVLVENLNRARQAYEQEDREIMSNAEYDKAYDELASLEKETGIVFGNSPTANVGFEVLSSLPKERHPSKMLSLDKTKSTSELALWLGEQSGILSWKMDGLTIVLTYENGQLAKAVTRGNGEIGEVITSNVKVFSNVPLNIPFRGRLILRGEAVIRYSKFEEINREMPETEASYKNPRNLCSGTVRQLNTEITAKRGVEFHAFSLVEISVGTYTPGLVELPNFNNSRKRQLEWLSSQGFSVVESKAVAAETVGEQVEEFAHDIKDNDIPSDGLVLIYDDIEYGMSLGSTSKFPRNAIAFKWKDETAETTLLQIEWSASRTGLINPIAIFEPVELEGTTVSRASVHNISILRELKLGIGDKIEVYKANMIIPQIFRNLTESGTMEIPDTCPVCGGLAAIKQDKDTMVLMCLNENCQAKHLKRFSHFVSRNAMNIDGLSEATLEKLISRGLIRTFADIFKLEDKGDIISNMEGFGEQSFKNLIKSTKKAAATTASRLLYGLGINGIGSANADLIARVCGGDWHVMEKLDVARLMEISGIGDVMAGNYVNFFADEENRRIVAELLEYVSFDSAAAGQSDELAGKTFVVTGSLNRFKSRDELKELIRGKGGKVAGSVSSKTDYLINNDSQSSSTKNKQARELGIPVITEAEFLETFLTGGSNA